MRYVFILFVSMMVIVSTLEASKFGKPIFCTEEHNPFKKLTIDSSGTAHIYGIYHKFIIDPKVDTLRRERYIEFLDSTYEIGAIGWQIFGKNSSLQVLGPKMVGYYGQDSTYNYLIFKNSDTTIAWDRKKEEVSEYVGIIFKTIYKDGKYWIFSNFKYLVTIDENTLEVDTVPIDGVRIKKYNTYHSLTKSFKDGFMYITLHNKYLHYFSLSSEEYFSIPIDSLIRSKYPEYTRARDLEIFENNIYILDEQAHIYVFNLETHELTSKDSGLEEVREFVKENLEGEDLIVGSIDISKNGEFYLGVLNSVKMEYRTFLEDENGIFHRFEVPHIDRAYVLLTPFDYYWFVGPYDENPDSDTNWVAVPYYPNGTSVESAPTMLGMKVAPNPAMLTTTVEFYLRPDLVDDLKFTVYNYLGGVVDKLDSDVEYDNGRFFASKRIDVTKYKTGIYYLVIDNGEEQKMVGFAVN